MTGRGQFDYVPGRVHHCKPPPAGGRNSDDSLPLGTVWKCFGALGEPTCGRRWRVTYIDSAFGGDLGWVRRRLPWRPFLNVERRPTFGVAP